MSAGAFIGTSGWYYTDWSARFYPADLPKSEWLAYYAARFPAVEINATFYRLPFRNMVKGWHDRAPAGFLFAVKGNRRITHLKKLAGVRTDLDNFISRIRPLEEHIGPLLWQLPPHFHCDPTRLEKFLRLLPEGLRHAVEFRHSSWLVPEVYDLLRAHNVASVSISSMRMPADFTVTADFVYLRFHGLAGGYAHDYTGRELAPWAQHAAAMLAEGRDVFAFFNNDAEACAPRNARTFKRMINTRLSRG